MSGWCGIADCYIVIAHDHRSGTLVTLTGNTMPPPGFAEATVDALRAELAAEKARADKAEADVAAMVKLYAKKNLAGYRDLAQRLNAAEARAQHLLEVSQNLVDERQAARAEAIMLKHEVKTAALSARAEAIEECAKACDRMAAENNRGVIGTPEDWALEANAMRCCATAIRALLDNDKKGG
jgi:hypothetical protein